MASEFEEKRDWPRTYFNNGENIAAALNGIGGEPFFVDILNVSAGGLQLSQWRSGATLMRPGDFFTLMALSGLADLQSIKGVRIEVRWVIDQDFLDIVSAGCKFHDISKVDQQKIQRLVQARATLKTKIL